MAFHERIGECHLLKPRHGFQVALDQQTIAQADGRPAVLVRTNGVLREIGENDDRGAAGIGYERHGGNVGTAIEINGGEAPLEPGEQKGASAFGPGRFHTS